MPTCVYRVGHGRHRSAMQDQGRSGDDNIAFLFCMTRVIMRFLAAIITSGLDLSDPSNLIGLLKEGPVTTPCISSLNGTGQKIGFCTRLLTLTGRMSHICDTQLLVMGTVVTNT